MSDAIHLTEAFKQYNRQMRIVNARIACLLAGSLMPLGAMLDFLVYPSHLLLFFNARLLCAFLIFLVWFILNTKWGERYYLIFSHGWYALPTFFMAWMIYRTEGETSPYYAGLNLVIVGTSAVVQGTFLQSIVSVSVVITCYFIAILTHGNFEHIKTFISNLYFIILTAVIVFTGSYFIID
ncbi:MAG: hypothetical protein R3F23_03915 [Verrucomicrobiia bacterium]